MVACGGLEQLLELLVVDPEGVPLRIGHVHRPGEVLGKLHPLLRCRGEGKATRPTEQKSLGWERASSESQARSFCFFPTTLKLQRRGSPEFIWQARCFTTDLWRRRPSTTAWLLVRGLVYSRRVG